MMPTWEEICDSVKELTGKINRKAEELTDIAALKMKVSSIKADLEDEYQLLGQLAYESLTSRQIGQEETDGNESASLTEQIRAVTEKITKMLADKAELDGKIEEIKNREK